MGCLHECRNEGSPDLAINVCIVGRCTIEGCRILTVDSQRNYIADTDEMVLLQAFILVVTWYIGVKLFRQFDMMHVM